MAISRTTRPALRTSRVGVAQKRFNAADSYYKDAVKEARKGCVTHSCVNGQTPVREALYAYRDAKSNLKAEQKRARNYAKKK